MRCLSNIIFLITLFALFGLILLENPAPLYEEKAPPAKEKAIEKTQIPPPELPELTIRPNQQNWLEKTFTVLFPSNYPSARMLMRAAQYDESFIYRVRKAVNPTNSGKANLGQVCDVFDFLYLNKVIISDPLDSEYFCTPEEYWLNHKGDCDDMAICMAAACNAIGAVSRITIAYSFDGHAYAELCLGDEDIVPYLEYLQARYPGAPLNYYEDDRGYYWLNLDLNNINPGGTYFEGVRYFYYYPSVRRWVDLKNP